jgi:hypothetical protein
LSCFVLFLCTQRRRQWAIVIFFCFVSVHLEKTTTSRCSSSSFFFFCFYAPRVDNDKLGLSMACHCFHSLQIPQKMTMNPSSSLLL